MSRYLFYIIMLSVLILSRFVHYFASNLNMIYLQCSNSLFFPDYMRQ